MQGTFLDIKFLTAVIFDVWPRTAGFIINNRYCHALFLSTGGSKLEVYWNNLIYLFGVQGPDAAKSELCLRLGF